MKKYFVVVICFFMLLALTGCKSEREAQIFVKEIESMDDNFLKGVDISSVYSLEQSGVKFYDYQGQEADIFSTLKESGVNAVRIRVWNDPYDTQGNGYGGGNNDIHVAKELGLRATNNDQQVLIDFHYSDFWADPSKQQAPKTWQSLTIEEKTKAIYDYTYESLNELLKEKVNVTMVQIGNETTGTFCDETNWINITTLFNSASKAIRDISTEYNQQIKIGVHFTNPEKAGAYDRYAMILENFNVDYDVFISSYYPFWHGSLENLSDVLTSVAETYGKEVMVGEVSYAYTMANGDEHVNTINEESTFEKVEPISIQGQANVIRDVMAVVSDIDGGIGVFYWEPAWIGVQGKTYEEQLELWERYGSGWASSYAGEYDSEDAGLWYGGSSWDNQALFDFEGHPLGSLDVFRLVDTGAETVIKPDVVVEPDIRIRRGQEIIMPEMVAVRFNDGTVIERPVVWDEVPQDIQLTAGIYILTGQLEDGTKATAKVTVLEPNYIENSGFESGDTHWELTNYNDVTTEVGVLEKATDARTDVHSYHFYSEDKVEFSIEQKVVNIKNGTYNLSVYIQGGDVNNESLLLYAMVDGVRYETSMMVDGWANWQQAMISNIPVTTGEILVGAYISCDEKGWGSLDDFSLFPVDDM